MGVGHPFTNRVIDELDYDEFSEIHLIPSFTIPVCVLAPLISLISHYLHFLYISNTQMKLLCQEGLAAQQVKMDDPFFQSLIFT